MGQCGILFFVLCDLFIFMFGCHSAADMALLLVFFHYLFYCRIELRCCYRQFFGYVFMYGCR